MPFSLRSLYDKLPYVVAASRGQIQANFKQIAEFDALAAQRSKQFAIATAIPGILAFIAFGLTEVTPFFSLVGCAFVAIAVAVSILGQHWKRSNLLSARYELLQQLIEMLSRDMAEDASFYAYLDFSKTIIKRKIASRELYPQRRGWEQTFYKDPWIYLQGQFADTTTFDLSLVEHAVVRSGKTYSRSGKTKRKCKTKRKGSEIQLRLRFPRKRYGAMSLLQADLPQAVSLPPTVVLKQIKANDHQLSLRVKAPANACDSAEDLYQLITQMFLSAYQALNLSKTLSKASV